MSAQRSLSASEAWKRLENTKLDHRRMSRIQGQVQLNTTLMLQPQPPKDKKQKRARLFLRDVQQRCGPPFVVLCIVGLGQARIAAMNQRNRAELLSILQAKKTHIKLGYLQGMISVHLQAIRTTRPKPETTALSYTYTLVTKLDSQADYLSARLLQSIDLSPIKIWEEGRLEAGTTETIRMAIPAFGEADSSLFLDIGSAQDLIAELFPPENRSDSPRYSLDPYVCTGASVAAFPALFGGYITQAIAESQLRRWELDVGMRETTECVSLEMRDSTSRYGILKLRLGWDSAQPIVHSLFT